MGNNAPIVNAFLWLGLWMALAVILFQSGTAVIAWWQGEGSALRAGSWAALLLPWMAGYRGFFSFLRRHCDACSAGERE